MNIYQQNNTSVRFTSVQIVNVTFYQIVIDSNVNNLLSRLKVSFSELENLVKLKMSSSDVKRKAIEINSTLEVLMNSTNEVDFNSRYEFSKKLIESCVCVINKYQETERDEQFGVELRQKLTSDCNSFFEREFGNQLNSNFWYELKYFEWLQKEGFIENHLTFHNPSHDRYFTDDYLEKFFSDNRGDIIRKMLNEQRSDGYLRVSSPLADNRTNMIFQAYKQLPSAT
ncbi:TPA: hypothetical protein ACPJ12_004659 [Vibrio diabolicus]|uniref:hypothetical protein n=1 Tax=Vibrio TaxID=662 RepID=UPI00215FC750|nr:MULTISPECIES: hypothetical protein [Vibrio]MCS0205523.1 hypothetical protein [Vibrio sp. HS-50-1]MCS0395383.1 hypothetical protein [Vibrio diabolicus]